MGDICDVMKAQTLRAIEGILQMDDSVSPLPTANFRLALISNGDGHATNGTTDTG
jgi:hypothetical protein